MHPTLLDRIANNLSDIGAISLDDYLDGQYTAITEPVDGDAVTRLHHACQRAFRNTDLLKFEFIEHPESKNKQCILTITKPDGARRSYATQPIFAKKNDAKFEAAKIALDMGALDFLAGEARPVVPPSPETSNSHSPHSDPVSVQSATAPETLVNDIEKCCLEWRPGRTTPHWVPFFDPKLPLKQGCALRIQLSPHVGRMYLSDPTFDTRLDAKVACAKAALLQGVLDFIKYGNGQTTPSSPIPSTPSTSQLPQVPPTTPWTLQSFYDSLPRPFPERFKTNDASEINALAWMNNMTQNARGGKLVLSLFFTSDGPPVHGCILKLDRPGEYRAFIVDARFPKRSEAKAAVCLQAISEGIGDYIRSITSAVDNKVTPAMRSFSSNLVYPALTSGLSKIDIGLHPRFEYYKERDAFGAALVVNLSTLPASGQVRRYTVSNEYRSKADAKVAVICHAAEQGVIEFVLFRGGILPDGYVSPFTLHAYNPDASRKRKQPAPAPVEDVEQVRPAKKKKRGKRRSEATSQGGVGHHTQAGYHSVRPSGNQVHGISGPGDMGQSQSIPMDDSCDPSRPGVGGVVGSGTAPSAVYGHRGSCGARIYPATLDPRFSGGGGMSSRGYGVCPSPGGHRGDPPHAVDAVPPESGPSRAWPGASSRKPRRPPKDTELEPGEVVSSAESDFSVGSSRNEDAGVASNERESWKESVDGGSTGGKVKETSSAIMPTAVSQDGPGITAPASHVKNLIDYCARRHCDIPAFHEIESHGRYQVWIVIGKERFDLPATYTTAEEGRQRVAKQVLARLSKDTSG